MIWNEKTKPCRICDIIYTKFKSKTKDKSIFCTKKKNKRIAKAYFTKSQNQLLFAQQIFLSQFYIHLIKLKQLKIRMNQQIL